MAMADMDIDTEEGETAFEHQYDMSAKVLLGEGTYGKVYKIRSIKSGEMVAVKQMKLDSQEDGVPATAIREVALLKELSHPNIVRLLDVHCKEPNKLVLVFEYLEHDLKKYMKTKAGRLSPGAVKNFAHQLCRGIEFCHSNRIIHRDIKPQNLLIDHRLALLKIADFGLARAFTVPIPKYTHEVVTVWYRPPEILLGSPVYSVSVDTWSIGCVLGDLATGAPLFPGDSEIDTCFKIFQKLGTPNEQVWPGVSDLPDFKATFPKWPHRGWAQIRNTLQQVGLEGINLLDGLMCYDPRRRISARQALQHQYFHNVDALCVE
jgi:cyclin-dependent kinase 2